MPAAGSFHVGNALEKASRPNKPKPTGVEGLAGLERIVVNSKTTVFVNPNKGNILPKTKKR